MPKSFKSFPWLHHSRSLTKPELYHAARDWQIMLAITALCLLAAFGAYFWLNVEVNKTPEASTITPPSYSTLTREEIVKYAREIEKP